MITKTTLDSIDIYSAPNTINKANYFNINFAGGRSTQQVEQVAHLCEHILLGFSTKQNGMEQPNEWLGQFHQDGRVKEKHVEFTFEVLNIDQLKQCLDTISNNINNIYITSERVENEKQIIVEELVQHNTLSKQEFEFFKKSLKSITVDMIKDYIKRNFTRNNLYVYVLNSNLDGKEIENAIKQFADTLPKKTEKTKIYEYEHIEDHINKANDINDKVKAETLNYVYKLPTLKAKEKLLLKLTSFYVGNPKLGIKKLLRCQKHLIYRSSNDITYDDDGTNFITSVSCSSKNAKKCKTEMQNWFKNLMQNGLTQEEFDAVKFSLQFNLRTQPKVVGAHHLRTIFDTYQQTQQQDIDEIVLSKLKPEANEYNQKNLGDNTNFLKLLPTITLEEVNEFIKKYITNQNILTQPQINTINK